MRFFLVAASLTAAVAAARTSRLAKEDFSWSYLPDKTADWYEENKVSLPEVAPAVTTVQEGKSYIVKLECAGCPFRVRTIGQTVETWQTPPQDNSLLLNFTIDDSTASLYLNGDRISPMAPLPLDIRAFQTPANLSIETMEKMVSQNMLDRSWVVGTKFGQFELEYEHTLLATKEKGDEWLQFDIKGVHIRQNGNPGSYKLNKEYQEMVQILFHQEIIEDKVVMTIKEITVIARNNTKDRKQPIMMPCGKPAMLRTTFNPLEWDYYGKFGTATRAWHKILWGTGEMIWGSRFLLIIAATAAGLYSLVQCCVRRSRAAVRLIEGDAEAAGALLDDENEMYDDAPPTYELASYVEDKEEDAVKETEVFEEAEQAKE